MDGLMNTAQQHALEQANLITQLIKYADRIILVESASDPERRAFVKLLDDQLPDHIDIIGLRASPTTTPEALTQMISETLQLSPGIESPHELATAVREALTASERVLVVIENAHFWLDTPQWAQMTAYLRAAHDLAPNQLLFLLTGDIGLTDHLRREPELADIQSDVHTCQLLTEASPPTKPIPAEAPSAATDQTLFADDPQDASRFDPSDQIKPTKRLNPTLLITAGISVAVIAFGGFALLTRSTDQPTKPQKLALNTAPTPTSPPPSQASTQPTQTDNPLPNDGAASPVDIKGSQATSSSALPTQPDDSAAITTQQDAAPTSATKAAPAMTPPKATEPNGQATASIANKTPRLIPPHADNTAEKQTQKPVDQPAATTPAKKAAPTAIKKPAAEAKPSKPEPKHKPKPKTEPKPKVKTVRVSGVDNAWYRARAPHRAALQIGAFNDEQTALNFIRKHAAHAPVGEWHVFSQKRNNQVLYTVTAGDFISIEAARKTLSQLPETLQKLKPYPRSFASIRKVISR